jgi:hypothetical protein
MTEAEMQQRINELENALKFIVQRWGEIQTVHDYPVALGQPISDARAVLKKGQ